MKKLLCAMLAVLMIMLSACSDEVESVSEESSSAPEVIVVSVPEESSEESSEIIEEPPRYQPPVLTAVRSAVAVYCVEDDELLYGENIDKRVAPASLTKLMTSAVALKYVNTEEVFTAGTEQYLVDPDSSIAYILPGHSLKLRDLITGMLLPSGNDAAYCVAVNTARYISASELDDRQAVTYFSILMNRFASELGMSNTNFANPDGWDNDAHYTTVSDLIKLTKYALTVPEIKETAALTKVDVTYESGETNTWYNSNPLLHPDHEFYCKYATGMKTGSTDNAGRCLIATFEKNKKTYIIITMGYETVDERCRDTLALFAGIQ